MMHVLMGPLVPKEALTHGDRHIDDLVYRLCGLAEEEVTKVVEPDQPTSSAAG